jgi:alpha-glucoside transport system permease protein
MALNPSGIRSIQTASPGGGMDPVGVRSHRLLSKIPTTVLWLLVVVWTVPTFGLFVNSFREKDDVRTGGWWTTLSNPKFTLDHYDTVLRKPPGGSLPMWEAFLNSFAIAIPATVVPIAIACAAAYAFAWMDFKGRSWLFITVIGTMAVPLQMALVPLQQFYNKGVHIGHTTILPSFGIGGTRVAVWLTHTGFGLPLAIFLLHNYISSLPPDVFEAARIDGANHFTTFWRIVLPLSKPAIASFAIFQFLWVWNDYLIALIFSPKSANPLTVELVNLVSSKGQGIELLPSAAFISMLVPIIMFFSLQRYFVRGLLAGSVKG